VVVALAAMLAGLCGCATATSTGVGTATSAPAATGTSSSPSSSATPKPEASHGSAALPTLCAAGRPSSKKEFKVNRDTAARAALMAGTGPTTGPTGEIGGAEAFEGLTVERLAQVLDQKFMDPSRGMSYPGEPHGPTHWDYFQFLCQHPSATVNGYMISEQRPDYGMFIDLIQMADATEVPLREQKRICRGAPTTTIGPEIFCWWDTA
jgi:hypothetical protein